jgi:hypothetical protein
MGKEYSRFSLLGACGICRLAPTTDRPKAGGEHDQQCYKLDRRWGLSLGRRIMTLYALAQDRVDHHCSK